MVAGELWLRLINKLTRKMSYLHPNRKDLGSRGSRSPATTWTGAAKRARMKQTHPPRPAPLPSLSENRGAPQGASANPPTLQPRAAKSACAKALGGEGRNREEERSAPKS